MLGRGNKLICLHTLNQLFSNLGMHENHLKSLLRYLVGNYPHSSQFIRSLSLRICVSSKFPGDAGAAAGLGTVLGEPLF